MSKKGVSQTWVLILVMIVLLLVLIIWMVATGKVGAWLKGLTLI